MLALVMQDRLQHCHCSRILPLPHAERHIVTKKRRGVAQGCIYGGARRMQRVSACGTATTLRRLGNRMQGYAAHRMPLTESKCLMRLTPLDIAQGKENAVFFRQ